MRSVQLQRAQLGRVLLGYWQLALRSLGWEHAYERG